MLSHDSQATSGRQQTGAETRYPIERLRCKEGLLVSTFLARLRRAMTVTNLHNFIRVEGEYERDIPFLLLSQLASLKATTLLNAQVVPNIPIIRSTTWTKI